MRDKKINDIHNYNTRHNNDYVIPMFKTNIVKYSLRYVGAKVYAEVPNGTKDAKTCNHFKYMVKQNILLTYYM